MTEERPGYQSYLLRMWRVEEERGDVAWRATLEQPRDGKHFAFPNLDAAFEFLRDRVDSEPEGQSDLPNHDG